MEAHIEKKLFIRRQKAERVIFHELEQEINKKNCCPLCEGFAQQNKQKVDGGQRWCWWVGVGIKDNKPTWAGNFVKCDQQSM